MLRSARRFFNTQGGYGNVAADLCLTDYKLDELVIFNQRGQFHRNWLDTCLSLAAVEKHQDKVK
ncbi:MAG: hypothetical protein AVDCRST_MAG26-4102 [uncultured Chloroflexia bacterium]|uniref:Uncharacterized protein n=1 Tax=uncultured Chloroflexia bacterium TaxID=1672391 RepID=A0A6J4JYR2_9CHLR|nr:MAG: hypothetical protein AVDCRST_MAG26-4102 [uncultured Chloroflexia bacterium]